jgi:hypothetical protein
MKAFLMPIKNPGSLAEFLAAWQTHPKRLPIFAATWLSTWTL